MYIGELSKISGVSVKAIRHYEEIGLIRTPERNGKYRVYDQSFVDVLAMIKLSKTLGFTLEELKEIASAKSSKGLVPIDLLREKVAFKRDKLLAQRKEIQKQLKGLDSLENSVAHYNQCLLEKNKILS